jgi:hypothetical protein
MARRVAVGLLPPGSAARREPRGTLMVARGRYSAWTTGFTVLIEALVARRPLPMLLDALGPLSPSPLVDRRGVYDNH